MEIALIDLPEWSGGRFGIGCPDCEDYSTNRIAIEEIERLRAEGNSRIDEIKYTIRIAEHPWHLNWSSRRNTIYFEKVRLEI